VVGYAGGTAAELVVESIDGRWNVDEPDRHRHVKAEKLN